MFAQKCDSSYLHYNSPYSMEWNGLFYNVGWFWFFFSKYSSSCTQEAKPTSLCLASLTIILQLHWGHCTTTSVVPGLSKYFTKTLIWVSYRFRWYILAVSCFFLVFFRYLSILWQGHRNIRNEHQSKARWYGSTSTLCRGGRTHIHKIPSA